MCKIADYIVFAMLLLCGIFDWRKKEIPVVLLLSMSVVISVVVLCCHTESIWSRFGGAAIGGVFFLISKGTKEAIGYGDSWLILLLGAYLGALELLQLLFSASVFSALCSLFYLWKRHWKRSATIPFVPFMVIGYLGVMFA